MTDRFIRIFGMLLMALALAGCAMTGAYTPGYLAAARRPAAAQAEGNVLVVTTPQDDAYVYTGSPTSLTGAASTLTLPLGAIVKEAAVAAFADTFRGGAEAASEVRTPARYTVIIAPRLVSYSYEYNQLKNVGFAITPTAAVTLEVRVIDSMGAMRWQRTYASGPVEGPAYFLNTSPQEEISKVTHRALYEMFAKAAGEVAREVVAKPVGAAAG